MSFLSVLPWLNVNFKNWKNRDFWDSSFFVSSFWARKKLPKEVFLEGVKLLSCHGSLAYNIFVALGIDSDHSVTERILIFKAWIVTGT